MVDAPKSLAVAVQMDPIQTVDIDADSTFVMALEAQARGHRLWFYLPQDLSAKGARIVAHAQPMTLRRDHGNHVTLGPAEEIDLRADVDVVLLRQDPPFNMSYLTTTYLLERLRPDTLVVNDPTSVRDAPEKLFTLDFADLMPATLITRRVEDIHAFRAEHKDIVVKPLFGNGGAGVFHITPDDENLGSVLEMFLGASRDPVIAQAYLPAVRQGDKRIILVDGAPVGAINRVPAAGEARANMHVGGRPEKSDLTAREREICDRLGPVLRAKGLVFVGIDVIGDKLTEINVTSPTGLQEIGRFDGTNLSAAIWDAIERRVAQPEAA